MALNRVEWLAGRRWAKDVCFASEQLLKVAGGVEKLLDMLHRGTVEKPASYAQGVREIITLVEDAQHVQALAGAA